MVEIPHAKIAMKINSWEERKIRDNASLVKVAVEIDGLPYIIFTPSRTPDQQLPIFVSQIDNGRDLLRNPNGFIKDQCLEEGTTPSGLVRRRAKEYVADIKARRFIGGGYMNSYELAQLVEQAAWEVLFEAAEAAKD